MFSGLKPITYCGREVWPLIEGGKGVSATNHTSSGAWAAAGGIGTVSAVNADSFDPTGKIIPQVYAARTRAERHQELIRYAIDGAVEQVRRAYDIAGGKGAININVLWEMGGAQQILDAVLERTKGLVAGVTLLQSTASLTCRLSARRAPFVRFGSGPIQRRLIIFRRWFMKTRGWRVAIMGSPMLKTP
jgi:hypothetical protein